MTRHALARAFVAVLATAIFAAILYRNFDLSAIGTLLSHSDRRWLAVGIVASIVTTFLRAARLSLVVMNKMAPPLIAASIVHNATTAILPMKLGEFALPLLLSRTGYMRLSEGLGVLLVLRVLDMLALLLVGSIAGWLAFSAAGKSAPSFISLAVLISASSAVILLFATWSALSEGLRGSRLLARIPALRKALLAATTASPRTLAHVSALSLLVWVSLFLAFFSFSRAVGIEADIFQAATIGAAASLAFAFPISGVANVGPFQAAWVWMSLQLGFATTPALAASLVSHGSVVLVTAALAAIAGSLLIRMQQRSNGTTSE